MDMLVQTYISSAETQDFRHASFNKFCSVRSWARLSKMTDSPQVFYKEPICPVLDFGFHFGKQVLKCLLLNPE